MSHDWLVLALLALGHAGLFVVAVNITHGLGVRERLMDGMKVLLLGWFVGGAALIAWAFLLGPWHSWTWIPYAYAIVCFAVALVGIPLSTLIRVCRRPPQGILSSQGVVIDLTETSGADRFIGNGRNAWMLRLPGNESFLLQKEECELTVPGLPPVLDKISLVQVSDLHFAPCFQREFFELVLDQASEWEADLAFFTGDLVDHDSAIDWVEPVMSRLRGRLGTFAILGNHDLHHHPRRLSRELERAGFKDLEGRWDRLEVDGAVVVLGGTSAPWGPPIDGRAMPEGDFRILLSHSPDRFPWAARHGVDLVLSGHNHGGQIRLPIIGPVLMPSVYSRRFDRGFFQLGKTLLHVSQGVAGKHPIRYGCVPQVTRLVLRAEPRRESSARTTRQVLESDPLRS